MRRWSRILAVGILLPASLLAQQQPQRRPLQPGWLFTDHAVLQRGPDQLGEQCHDFDAHRSCQKSSGQSTIKLRLPTSTRTRCCNVTGTQCSRSPLITITALPGVSTK